MTKRSRVLTLKLPMNKTLKILIFIICFGVVLGRQGFAQMSVIQLKDGSSIKGSVSKLEDHVYTIETSTLGAVKVNDSDIVNISAGDAPNPSSPSLPNANPLELKGDPKLMAQVQSMQGTILSDPALMADI